MMKKYESLYKMMNYVYKKDRFTLQELRQEFGISKSTALRYIKALEDIGVPLYSEMGRYGGYRILDTYKVPPVTFTPQETYALFFALKGIEFFGSLPFRAEYGTIRAKFLETVSPKIQNTLALIQTRVSFGAAKMTDDAPLLEDLLQAVMEPTIIRIVYQSPNKQTERRVQPIGIYANHGHWYCPSYDLDQGEYRVFRCDRIVNVTVLDDEQPMDLINEIDLNNRFQLVNQSKQAIEYAIEISAEGQAIFERHHYPNMSLSEKDGHFCISGWIEPAERLFLLQYCHRFGTTVLDIQPPTLKQDFVKQLQELACRLH